MDKLIVRGGRQLFGTVQASGSKNSVLPILAATLMADGPVELRNVPNLSDLNIMLDILEELGVQTSFEDGVVRTEVVDKTKFCAPFELVSQMRASFCVLGPLIGARRRAKVSLPGGCVIGVRPVDLHVKGLKYLGADMQTSHGYIEAEAKELHGAHVFLGGANGSSVTGTANLMMAAVLAEGETIIEQAACEPELEDLADFLNKMGAKIEGAGSPKVKITGVKSLTGTTHSIIPDRIEAETFMVAAAVTQGDVTVTHCRPDHMFAVSDLLQETGAQVDIVGPDTVRVRGTRHIKPVELTTFTYPGFPTDTQAQYMALLTIAEGISVVTEKIYPDRFMHVAEFMRMGANIRKTGNTAIIHGVEYLSGCPVTASDLRASAGLILAALAARGESEIHAIHHLDRGYDRMEVKLQALGADIRREKFSPRRRKEDRGDRRAAA